MIVGQRFMNGLHKIWRFTYLIFSQSEDWNWSSQMLKNSRLIASVKISKWKRVAAPGGICERYAQKRFDDTASYYPISSITNSSWNSFQVSPVRSLYAMPI